MTNKEQILRSIASLQESLTTLYIMIETNQIYPWDGARTLQRTLKDCADILGKSLHIPIETAQHDIH